MKKYNLKKIISLTIILSFTSSHTLACEKHLDMQIEDLKRIFKEGASEGFATLNKDGLNVKTSYPDTNYSVCYQYKDKQLYRVASSKEILANENVTNDKSLVKIIKKYFQNADGKKMLNFEYKGIKKIAKAIDVNLLNSKFQKDIAVCAAENIDK